VAVLQTLHQHSLTCNIVAANVLFGAIRLAGRSAAISTRLIA
jgi:hypothetical protein